MSIIASVANLVRLTIVMSLSLCHTGWPKTIHIWGTGGMSGTVGRAPRVLLLVRESFQSQTNTEKILYNESR